MDILMFWLWMVIFSVSIVTERSELTINTALICALIFYAANLIISKIEDK